MIKNKRSEVEEFMVILEKQGFAEITDEEKKTDEFRNSISCVKKYISERSKGNKKIKSK